MVPEVEEFIGKLFALHLDQGIAEKRKSDLPVTGEILSRMNTEQVMYAGKCGNIVVKCLLQVMKECVCHK